MGVKRITSEERRKIIVRASIEVFSKSNFRVAKVPEIARLAGVTEPVVYNHFKTKKNLFLEILKIVGMRTTELIERKAVDVKGNVIERLEYMILYYLSSMNKYRRELKIYYQAISEIDDPEISRVLQDSYKSYANFISKLLKEGVGNGELREDLDIRGYSWKLVGVLIHLSTFYLLDLYRNDDAQKLVKQHINELYT